MYERLNCDATRAIGKCGYARHIGYENGTGKLILEGDLVCRGLMFKDIISQKRNAYLRIIRIHNS